MEMSKGDYAVAFILGLMLYVFVSAVAETANKAARTERLATDMLDSLVRLGEDVEWLKLQPATDVTKDDVPTV
jgi:hypothetical protein